MTKSSLTLTLSDEEMSALQKIADEFECSLEVAARAALRDWIKGNGYLKQGGLEEDTPTEGNA